MFINATSVGNLSLKNKVLITDDQIKNYKNKYIYDVNFKPEETKLLKKAKYYKIKNQNGKSMNLFQA